MLAVSAPAPVSREPGAESSACFAGAHSPWPPPFAPPTPRRLLLQMPPAARSFALFRDDRHVILIAFDRLELDGKDLRREPIYVRKAKLARLVSTAPRGLQCNEHIADLGEVVFRHACQLGYEGIVSKRLGSRYTAAATGSSSRIRRRRP